MTVAGSGGHSGRPNVPHSVITGANTDNVICNVELFTSFDQSKDVDAFDHITVFQHPIRELSHRCHTAGSLLAVQSPCCAGIGKK